MNKLNKDKKSMEGLRPERRELPPELITMINEVKHMSRSIDDLKKSVRDMDHSMQNNFVSQFEFKPVRMIIYAQTGVILLSFVSALVMMVFK